MLCTSRRCCRKLSSTVRDCRYPANFAKRHDVVYSNLDCSESSCKLHDMFSLTELSWLDEPFIGVLVVNNIAKESELLIVQQITTILQTQTNKCHVHYYPDAHLDNCFFIFVLNCRTMSSIDDDNTCSDDAIWHVVSAYFRNNGLVQHQLDSYNYFVRVSVQKIIDSMASFYVRPVRQYHQGACNTPVHDNHYEVRFGQVSVAKPQQHNPDNSVDRLYPMDARLRNLTYEAPLYCEMTKCTIFAPNTAREKRSEEHVRVFLGTLPVMVNSEFCALHFADEHDRYQHKECPTENGGYFIIDGSERAIVAQERVANNLLCCYRRNGASYSYHADIKSTPYAERNAVPVFSCRLHATTGEIEVVVPYVRGGSVPLFVLFRALGELSDRGILECIAENLADTDMMRLLQPSIDRAASVLTERAAQLFIGRLNSTRASTPDERVKQAIELLQHNVLPHCGTEVEDAGTKVLFLGYMCNQLLSVALGRRQVDDRDHLAAKRIDTSGPLLCVLFQQLFRKLVDDATRYVQKTVNMGRDFTIDRCINPKTLGNGIQYALRTGNWTSQRQSLGTSATGVSQVLSRLTVAASSSHLRRTRTPNMQKGKLAKPRQLHYSSWGLLCPAETPEGADCGLTNNLALLATLSVASDNKAIWQQLVNLNVDPLLELTPTERRMHAKVFLNGVWVGAHIDPVNLVTQLRQLRRTGQMHMHVSIVHDIFQRAVHLRTDHGRIMRPLFIVDESAQRLRYTQQHADALEQSIERGERDGWQTLFDLGLIEYLDADEEGTRMLAMNLDDFLPGAFCQTYTHCEVHPCMSLGVSASIIPFPDHNQAPRNTYQSSMGKQAMGVYITNFQKRMDTLAHVLNYPQRPLVSNCVMKYLGFDDLPAGINAIVAIACYTGYNQEDSQLMNQSAIDRGLFRSTFYRTYTDCEVKQSLRAGQKRNQEGSHDQLLEQFQLPDRQLTKGMGSYNYEALDVDGLALPGSRVADGSVLVGKVMLLKPSAEHAREQAQVFRNRSQVMRSNETGIIDRVMMSSTQQDMRMTKVRVRTQRTPEIGDKFCLTDDHEVLTATGWKSIAQVQLTDCVACLDQTNEQLRYCLPTELHDFAYTGDLYRVETDQVDLLATMEHRMYVKRDSQRHFTLHDASSVYRKPVHYRKNTRNQLMLSGLSVTTEDVGRLAACFERFNRSVALEQYAKITALIMDLDQHKCRLFVNLLCAAQQRAYGSSASLGYFAGASLHADEFQRLCLHAGWSSDKVAVDDGRSGWLLSVNRTNNQPAVNCTPDAQDDSIVSFTGRVYCISVPTQVFYVRRNGKCVWTGNSSRHGQKGTVGMTYRQEDMPFTQEGITPDIIMNPHAVPSRMTIGQIIECVLAKVATMIGNEGDATPFVELDVDAVCDLLHNIGYRRDGYECMYNGHTGKRMEAPIFIGPTFYQRLKHMSGDKIHARPRGPMNRLTRQPTDGRSKNGGLRFGEMERDCVIAYGASEFLRDRLMTMSDPCRVHVCDRCHIIATQTTKAGIYHCPVCAQRSSVSAVRIPYAYKLLIQEKYAMGVRMKMHCAPEVR